MSLLIKIGAGALLLYGYAVLAGLLERSEQHPEILAKAAPSGAGRFSGDPQPVTGQQARDKSRMG
jgi:hypothetical protein